MFPNVKIMVFLFLCFLMFVCAFLQKHFKIGVSANLGHCCFGLLGSKCRVNNWATVGSTLGPHVGSYFLRHMWPSYSPNTFV